MDLVTEKIFSTFQPLQFSRKEQTRDFALWNGTNWVVAQSSFTKIASTQIIDNFFLVQFFLVQLQRILEKRQYFPIVSVQAKRERVERLVYFPRRDLRDAALRHEKS